MSRSRVATAVLLVLAVPAAPCAQGVADPAPPSELAPLIEGWRADRGALQRRYAVPMSDARRERLDRLHEGWLERIARVDFDALSRPGQIDWLLFANTLRRARAELVAERARDAEVAGILPWTGALVPLLEAGERREPVDPAAAAQTVDGLARAVDECVKGLRGGKPPATLARRAAGRVGALRRAAEQWFAFRNGYDPTFSWWLRKPFEALSAALGRCEAFLRDECLGKADDGGEPLVGDPIGREGLRAELDFEFIPYSPEELIAIAEREFAWCDAEFERAAAELGFPGDWRRAQEHVKSLHVAPGEQPETIAKLAAEAEAFLDAHGLITIPELARETWRMQMMSPERQLVSPFFLGGECILVSFPTDAMTHEAKLQSMRGNNVHFCRATVHHELIPGHHLQQFMQARHRPYRETFETPFWVEGWALYWEMLLYDRGFARTPEDRVGMLFWRKHRCARIVFSLRFHLGEWTPQQCIDYLVDRVGHERNNATAEVRRSIVGLYAPLYQAAYLLGGLQLRALEEELVGEGKMTERAFHDAVLRENSMPIAVLRAALTDGELSRDFKASWRF